jgi:hypothetical protein
LKNSALGRKGWRDYERKDRQSDHYKADIQMRNWRNENWSSNTYNAKKLAAATRTTT